MSEPQYTLKQFTDLNRSVNQLDFLIYLENDGIVTLNRKVLKEHKDSLIDFMNKLIKNWKETQEYEFEEILKAEQERKMKCLTEH